MAPEKISVRCCIAGGGGPAGMMLGYLLARAGVMVLEKHGDFLRDFRGDTIHRQGFSAPKISKNSLSR